MASIKLLSNKALLNASVQEIICSTQHRRSLPVHESHFLAVFSLELHISDWSLPTVAWSSLAAESANGVPPVTSTTRQLPAISLLAKQFYQRIISSGGGGQKKLEYGGGRKEPHCTVKNTTGWLQKSRAIENWKQNGLVREDKVYTGYWGKIVNNSKRTPVEGRGRSRRC